MNIVLTNISFAYAGSRPLFENISLKAAGGEVVAVVGGAGHGKSTLLKIYAGLLEPTLGDVLIDGKRFWSLTDIEQQNVRRKMGFDFQEGALISNMTIHVNLALPLRYHGEMSEGEISKTVEGWLSRMGLESYRNMLPAALSFGLKRRASLARAMLCGRDAFFFDDPSQVVDDVYREELAKVVGEKKKAGALIFIATGERSYLSDLVDKTVEI